MGEKITAQQSRKEIKPVQQQAPSAPKQAAPVQPKEEKADVKVEQKADEVKVEKKVQPKVTKKEEAVARGDSVPISKKHSMFIGYFIKGKTIDASIAQLQEVIKFKRAIPFTGEIPHRSDPGMMSGRYPINASKHFINMLKALKGNVLVNGMDLDKTRIFSVMANWAHRPQTKGGARSKRTHITIIAREIKDLKLENKENKK